MTTATETIVPINYPSTHDGQRTVMCEADRFNWLAAGRRWYKTTLCMRIATQAALDGAEILWCAPTYDQVRIGWDEAKRAIGHVATFNEGKMEAKHPDGGRIQYRSLDNPDNARGHTADGVVIDEASLCAPSAWHEVIRPMLITTGGWAWLIGTPRGRNWYWQEWRKAAESEIADSIAWQAPSLGVVVRDGVLHRAPHPLENPNIPFSEMQALYNSMPERVFRQEILAEFMADGGGVFRGLDDACILQPAEWVDDHLFTVGVDWGRSNDYTVVSVMDSTPRPVRQVFIDRFSQIGYELQMGRLRAVLERYQPISIVAELNSMGGPLVETLQTEGYPVEGFQTTAGSKKQLIEDYALGIERGKVLLLDDDTQKLELGAYESETLPGGMIRYNAPEGMHDDTVIAGALAWSRAKGDYLSEDAETDEEREERLWQEQLVKRGGAPRHTPGIGDPRRLVPRRFTKITMGR